MVSSTRSAMATTMAAAAATQLKERTAKTARRRGNAAWLRGRRTLDAQFARLLSRVNAASSVTTQRIGKQMYLSAVGIVARATGNNEPLVAAAAARRRRLSVRRTVILLWVGRSIVHTGSSIFFECVYARVHDVQRGQVAPLKIATS